MNTYVLARYVGKTVLFSIIAALLLLVGLDLLGTLISENNNYVGDYDFREGLIYVMLLFPSTVNEYVPFACLVGCLIGLGTLASNSELVILRAAGISIRKIILMSLVPAVFVLLVDIVMQQWVSPDISRYAETRRSLLQYGDLEVSKHRMNSGLWFRDKNTFMHINTVDPAGELFGATIFEFDETGQLSRAMYAPHSVYTDDKWYMKDVTVTAFANSEADGRIGNYQRAREPLDIALRPELLEILVVSPDRLSPSGLYSYMNYLNGQGVNAGEYELAFWEKVFQPLAGIALVLVAASFIFGPLRESTTGYRVFVAVIVGIVFNTSQDLLGPSSLVFGFPAWLAIFLPIAIYLVIGFLLARRVN